jgi:DNA-binding LacI/PurR family transcriptional regulator
MSKPRPTIADVAKAAGVSKGLVSFALNDRPGVSPETRTRILEASRELGWTPSLRGRSLSSDKSFALGLVIARNPEVVASDSFYTTFIAGTEKILAPQGRALVLSMVPNEILEADTYRKLFADGRVDGVILTDLRSNDNRLPLLTALGVQAVTLGRPDVESPYPSVLLDDGPGIRDAVQHLVELGHTRIAHVGGPSGMLHGGSRRASFIAQMTAARLDPSLVVETDFSAADGARATSELLGLNDRPTAIVYSNDSMAIAGIGVARRAGLGVPDDLSVTGFDDIEIGRHLYPSLTTVATDALEWGSRAADVLLQLIAGVKVDDVSLPPARLVIRESTAAPSVRSRIPTNHTAAR